MSFKFDENGFLTARHALLEAGIYEAYKALFARAHEINRDCHRLLFSVTPHNEDGREVLVTVVFIRALEHYQAAVLLLNGGLIAPAKVAIRATLEAVFTARAIAKDEKALKAFITDDLLQRQKLMRKAQKYQYTNIEELRKAATPEVIKDLDAEIKEFGASHLTTEQLAKLADMHDWYITVYALLTKAAHTHARDLEQYLILDQNGKIRSLDYAPSIEEVRELLLTVAHAILIGSDAIVMTFGVQFEAKEEHVAFISTQFDLLPGKTPGSHHTES